MSNKHFSELVCGAVTAQCLFLAGGLEVHGDMGHAMKFEGVLKAVREAMQGEVGRATSSRRSYEVFTYIVDVSGGYVSGC